MSFDADKLAEQALDQITNPDGKHAQAVIVALVKKVREEALEGVCGCPGLTARGSDAIAYQLERGYDNGKIGREALADWLRRVAQDYWRLDVAIRVLKGQRHDRPGRRS